VSPGTAYCPNCGNAIPPSWPPVSQPVVAPRKSRIGVITGLVLVALLVTGVGGYLVYNNAQQQVLFAAKNTEQTSANEAPSQIQFTCFAITPDGSHLTYDQYTHTYAGYALISEKFGLSNPTRFAMDASWTLTIDFTSLSLVLTSTEPFHLAPNGAAHPIFAFQVTGAQYNSLPSNPDFSKFTTTLAATYAITGTYSTYNLTQHSTYNSVTGTGTGTLASSANMTPC